MTNKLTLERIFGDPDINGETPVQLRFSPLGDLVSYLKPNAGNFEQLDLWVYDIATGKSRCLVNSAELLEGRTLSNEEKARRERLRISATGIVEYYWSPTGSALLFPVEGNLYLYHLEGDNPPIKLTDATTFETNLSFSPDGEHLAFVRDQDLFTIRLSTRQETRLTTDGGDAISNGLAEFIAQEEMHRYDGYWWSPDGNKIAFTRVDESPVILSQRYEIDAESFGVFDQRYPFTGTRNASVTLHIVSLDGSRIDPELPRSPESYLARVDWRADSQSLAVQIQSRSQQQLELRFCSLDDASETIVLTESSDGWINLHNAFRALPGGDFIWASAKTGYLHLYHHDQTGKLITVLTAGPWVINHLHGLDAHQHIYFTGNCESPLEQHLYRVSLLAAGNPERPEKLTETGTSHQISMNKQCNQYIDHASSYNSPPSVVLREIKQVDVKELVSNKLVAGHPFFDFSSRRAPVHFGTIDATDGQTLHYRLIEPQNRSAGAKYPLILTVYGGPGVQRVTNEWIPPWHHYMSQRGYGLLQLDNRGTANRGSRFEFAIHKQLGVAEVEDQLAGISMACQCDWVDPTRLGVFGHSYGGYMTLMLMMKSDRFKAGVSVAPVTDWRLYDTHYTERYLLHPDTNSTGYDMSNVFPYAANLKGRVMVVHGMADDNVLFTNSTKLYKVLQDLNIQFDIMSYPGAKHGLGGRKTNLHRYTMMDQFFDLHLKG